MAPVLVNLITVDLSNALAQLTLLAFAGYLIRAAILFAIGCLWALFYKNEESLLKIFQLGIVAPAMITALMNGNQIKAPKAEGQITGNNRPVTWLSLASAAYAASPQEDVKKFSLLKETSLQEFLRGLTGSRTNRIYFVIVGQHQTKEEAKSQAKTISDKNLGFKADVYAPYGDIMYFSVVIGANLTFNEAAKLQKRAIESKLAENVSIWTFPNK